MSQKAEVINVKVEGVGHNAAWVAGLTQAAWLKHGKERYYFTVGGNTVTPEQQESILIKAYEVCCKTVGVEPKRKKVEDPKPEE